MYVHIYYYTLKLNSISTFLLFLSIYCHVTKLLSLKWLHIVLSFKVRIQKGLSASPHNVVIGNCEGRPSFRVVATSSDTAYLRHSAEGRSGTDGWDISFRSFSSSSVKYRPGCGAISLGWTEVECDSLWLACHGFFVRRSWKEFFTTVLSVRRNRCLRHEKFKRKN